MKLNKLFLVGVLVGIFLILVAGLVFGAGEPGEPATIEYTPGESGSFSFLEGFFTLFGNVFGAEDSEYGAEGAKLFLNSETGENFLNVMGEESIVKLGENIYEDMESDSFFQFDSEGSLIGADLIASDETLWSFPEYGYEDFALSKGDRITIEEGIFHFQKGESDSTDTLFNWNGESFELLGDSFKMNLDENGNYFFNGNLKTDLYDISGTGEEFGSFVLDRDNKIVEVWKGTKASLYGIDLEASGNNVKISYKDDFDVSKHEGTNYFNFGDNKINAGGSGWGFRLEDEENKPFGNMMTEKEFHGQEPKKRFLDVSLYGGNVEIEKKTVLKPNYCYFNCESGKTGYFEEKDVGFSIKAEGLFQVDNGRVTFGSKIETNTEGMVFHPTIQRDTLDGKIIPASDMKEKSFYDGEDFAANVDLFVKKSDFSENSFSYDMNIEYNGKEYSIQDNIFRDNQGNELVNANYWWENVRLNALESLENEGLFNEVSGEIKSETGVTPNDYRYFAADSDYEGIFKNCYNAADFVMNNNEIGFENLSPGEVCTVLLQEGFLHTTYNLRPYEEDANYMPINYNLGLDTLTSPGVFESRKEQGLIPDFIKFYNLEGGQAYEDKTVERYDANFKNIEEATYAFAGEYAYYKKFSQDAIVENYGQEYYDGLTETEKSIAAYSAFNGGKGNFLSKMDNFENEVLAKWGGSDNPLDLGENMKHVLFNANRVVGTFEFLKRLVFPNFC